ncbi:MAG TPA: response regulator transcription factor, partial [Candidatus Saccharimonadales bacterium]|nr:response regulator transcription factor [Candidatus Saccharimonadales bacterium]
SWSGIIGLMHLPRLLLIDDDRSIARALSLALRNAYMVDIAGDGEVAMAQATGKQYAAIILDLNLPGLSGLEVCRHMRDAGLDCPILVLTGESEVITKITLLDAGANDYLTKPFSLGELKARLRALLRNQRPLRHLPRRLSVDGLLLDRRTHTVTRDGSSIRLRRKEFALLECLMEHAGSVVTRSALVRHGWQGAEQPWTNTVDVHIKYLRDKLDRPFDRPLIQTVHGLGYRLNAEPPATDK